MKVTTRTITLVRMEATEPEWAVLRQLVAEGLSVTAQITESMAAVAAQLGLQVQEPAAGAPHKSPRKKAAISAPPD